MATTAVLYAAYSGTAVSNSAKPRISCTCGVSGSGIA
jgi:hypothetical protein